MRVEIDDKSGFCFGVVRAITKAEQALGGDATVYSLGDMQRMTEKVRSIDGVYPNGRSASYTLVE